jgi:hypothetical protein
MVYNRGICGKLKSTDGIGEQDTGVAASQSTDPDAGHARHNVNGATPSGVSGERLRCALAV